MAKTILSPVLKVKFAIITYFRSMLTAKGIFKTQRHLIQILRQGLEQPYPRAGSKDYRVAPPHHDHGLR